MTTGQWHNEQAAVLDLAGEWDFALSGQRGSITVPACWETQVQDHARREEGPAVYERRLAIPADWAGRRVQLQFDAVSYHCAVEVNGVAVGEHSGSWSAFAFDVSAAIRPGAPNRLRLTVTKPGERFPVRESLAGFLPDVMLMFGGVWQAARLVAFDGPALGDLQIRPEAQTGRVMVTAPVHFPAGQASTGLEATVTVHDADGQPVTQARALVKGGALQALLAVPDPALWGPDDPALYTLVVTLESGAVARRTFGFRALAADGAQLTFNGAPVCLRGALNWGWYPDVLCPAPDEATIREEFRRLRALGFNLMKLCLYVPDPLYFRIADEEGVFLWLELPLWLPEVTDRLRQHAPQEYAAIMAAVHHHPSIILYSLGCELDHAVDADLLATLDATVRGPVCGALLCDNSGSGEAYGGLGYDFADFNDYHFYADLHYFAPLVDHFRRDWRRPRPWIFGEFCDADDYRDLDEIAAAYGGDLPWWLTEWNPLHAPEKIGYPAQRDRMNDRLWERLRAVVPGLDGQTLMRRSRQGSFVVRKFILEQARARAGMGGYVVTSLRDTPLATSAVYDDLGRPKYPPDVFRQFNTDSALLLGRGRARRWTNGGDRPAPQEPYSVPAGQPVAFNVLLAHTGALLAGEATLRWRVLDGTGATLHRDQVAITGPLPAGRPDTLARIVWDAPDVAEAVLARLDVDLTVAGLTEPLHNHWLLWVFPTVSAWPEGVGLYDPAGALAGLDDFAAAARPVHDGDFAGMAVVVTSVLDKAVLAYLQAGGAVLLLQGGPRPLPALAVPFWREGIKLIADHPLMAALPHEGTVGLQYYGLATDHAFQIDELPAALPGLTDYQPLLRRLDARQFTLSDYLFTARVGSGRLTATTLRLSGGEGDQPLSLSDHLAGRWLLRRLLDDLLPPAPAKEL